MNIEIPEYLGKHAIGERLDIAMELLYALEWDVHGKCPWCQGWKMPEGERRRKHTDNCALAKFLRYDSTAPSVVAVGTTDSALK